MTKKFLIEIELGNAQMENVEDIQFALKNISKQLEEREGTVLRPVHSRSIFDINGNTVGSWNIEESK